jgi:hypothetical protein
MGNGECGSRMLDRVYCVPSSWFLDPGFYSLLATRHSLLATRYSLLATRYSRRVASLSNKATG